MKSHQNRAETAVDLVEKVLLLGDISVGKTSIITRFTEGAFFENMANTIGVEYHRKTIKLKGKGIEMEIWDTSGQERYQSIAKSFYRGCMGIIIVFDVTSEKSFGNVKSWIEHLNSDADSEVIKILVGNKSDLKDEFSSVDKIEIAELTKECNLVYFETSAKSGENIKEAFEFMALQIYDKVTDSEPRDRRVSLASSKRSPKKREDNEKSDGCCN